MKLDLYRGRPGFSWPYTGPTGPESSRPEGWEGMTLEERLEHKLRSFDDSEADVDADEGEGIER